MFDVLIYFYENLRALAACRTQGALMRRLSAAGFDKNEVSEAIAWLQGLARIFHRVAPADVCFVSEK